jgi:hypothetical protein
MMQIQSVYDGFNTLVVARLAIATLAYVEAVGLLGHGEVIETLDFPTLRKVVQGISHAGIGQGVLTDAWRSWWATWPAPTTTSGSAVGSTDPAPFLGTNHRHSS